MEVYKRCMPILEYIFILPAGHLVVLGLKSSDTKTKKLKAEHVIYPWKADILVIRTMQSTQQVKSVSLSYHQQLNKQQQI